MKPFDPYQKPVPGGPCPKGKYTIKLNIKSIKKAEPKLIEPYDNPHP